jgi:hypothetical protein
METLKLIITSKENLKKKYQNNFSKLNGLFNKLIAADQKRGIKTQLVFIDDSISAKKAGLSKTYTITEKNCKQAFDIMYREKKPAYMVIFGAQDIFPFQKLNNELYIKSGEADEEDDRDEDRQVPSDLPYACDAPYSNSIASFIAPTRVVGRIPDLPDMGDIKYVATLIQNIIKQKPVDVKKYMNYFSVSTSTWKTSTRKSLENIFYDSSKLLSSPKSEAGSYSKTQLKALSHFFNCHGSLKEASYLGQRGGSYPYALVASDLDNAISFGTVVAAECCYGAQLLDPAAEAGMSIANNYLGNNALAFVGSSTIAYGPARGQGLADLICQYFMIGVHNGASSGRALLEARHKFINVNGPNLDPCELKTLGQFYLLGDPSVTLVQSAESDEAYNTVENRRENLHAKGIAFGKTIAPSIKTGNDKGSKHKKELSAILENTDFKNYEKEIVFKSQSPTVDNSTRFRAFPRKLKAAKGLFKCNILVVKENDDCILGWRVYSSKQ